MVVGVGGVERGGVEVTAWLSSCPEVVVVINASDEGRAVMT